MGLKMHIFSGDSDGIVVTPDDWSDDDILDEVYQQAGIDDDDRADHGINLIESAPYPFEFNKTARDAIIYFS